MSDDRDTAPGDDRQEGNAGQAILGYTAGLALAAGLTVASFLAPVSGLVWAPAVPVALAVLGIAQMGVHLAFFLHLGTGPDHTNNIMAVAFGLLIVLLVMTGSLWIMSELNHNMPAMPAMP